MHLLFAAAGLALLALLSDDDKPTVNSKAAPAPSKGAPDPDPPPGTPAPKEKA